MNCPTCKTPLTQGLALIQNYRVKPYIAGVVNVWTRANTATLRSCLKCKLCGFSVSD
jgi:hypothetical protein